MVLLTLKNLQQQTFQVEIDITASVKELKEKIEKDKGKDYPAVGQKLIYAGKILQDDNKLESYTMDINKFLVIMVTKPKSSSPPPEAAPAATTSSDAAAATAATTSATDTTTTETQASGESSTNTTATTSTTTTTTPAAAASAVSESTINAESLLVVGDEFNKMVDNIMEMGYERPQVERALRASFNNPYTAVQYLVDGIPDSVAEDSADPPAVGGAGGGGGEGDEAGVAGALAAAAAATAEAGSGGAGGDGDDPLAFLRSQPQFVQMTQMMRTNPQLLDAFLQQIRTTNPGLLQAIQENQEAFVRMINQPPAAAATPAAPAAGGGGDAPQQGGGGGQGGRTTIMLTQQDRDAIDRLRGLGNFPEELVVQAYFACEKNENLAAEFLFSQAWD